MRRIMMLQLAVLVTSSLVPIIEARANEEEPDITIADFEGDDYDGWTVEGEAFGRRPARGPLPDQPEIQGQRGRGFANSFVRHDAAQGKLVSPAFTINRDYLSVLVGGGNRMNVEGIELHVDGKVTYAATGANSALMIWNSWDLRSLQGKSATLEIFDRASDGWGYTLVDEVLLTNRPRRGSGALRLQEYRDSPEYMRETYRPQFHFTPEMNWMNDPNGLVYFDGEYHLFYQHNPHGNSWGHMSWGHAVSRDMVHWKHLPIALHEEYGVMIFSGCCVIDWRNTSGFGKNGQPPMVAIYTGHGLGKQTQDIAYSNDKGRTWVKYEGNPVLDKNEADFRDPKVFWHQPTNRWIMVVSMANAKFVQFYASSNLKQWTHLSDFGPAGVKDKPNWECPDLFQLPIEGSGAKKWVLEVDMGGGAVAGGSGGEYFIGEFDGYRFTCDHDPNMSQWVDYGRDFYAPVSFSDIPKEDGRRIWIGWMNNWETNQLPTRPWRSAMSIPRTLALRRNESGYKLVQYPVEELRALRGKSMSWTDMAIDGTLSLDEQLRAAGISGDQLEIHAEIEIMDSREVGFHVRASQELGELTVVGFNSAKKELFVDRGDSGEDSFHANFPGTHAGPLSPKKGVVELTLFVDHSSVEVFGGGGEIVLTERIFPDPSSRSLQLYSQGDAKLRRLEVWALTSIWQSESP